MSNANVIKSLAKVLAALAWADGSIANQELNQLKSLLIGIPGMTAADWAEIDIYLDSPVDESERQRLVRELRDGIRSSQDKAYALSVIDALVNADGASPENERVAYSQVRSVIESAGTSVFGGLGRLVGGNRTPQAGDPAPNRELYIDDFMRNKIFYNVSRRLEMDTAELEIPEDKLRKLSLAGGLMALIAYVDRDLGDGEIEQMVEIMREHWQVNDFEANLVAEVAVSESTKGLDGYLLASQLFDITNEEEKLHFMDVLFAVADADGGVSYEETEEIRVVATIMKLTHQQFISAKLKIPIERRISEVLPRSNGHK
jgi:uncharacterized tellurite resistance protein B-like protein